MSPHTWFVIAISQPINTSGGEEEEERTGRRGDIRRRTTEEGVLELHGIVKLTKITRKMMSVFEY